MVNLSVSLSGVTLKNPLIPASGTFGFGHDWPWYDVNLLGAICLKGTTKAPRFGNPTPRIAEAPAGMLNAVGLQNPGIDAVLAHELPALRKVYAGPVIANISGFSEEEYAFCCEKAAESPYIDIVEVNISCPNVHAGGLSFGATAAAAASVTKAVRAVCRKPIYIKLSPNVTDIAEIARACEASGADGISVINTLLAMRIDVRRRRPVLANQTGGLSGPAVFPVALRCVWQVYEAVKLPIIGMGGVSSAEDVVEMLLAGASAVQIGAANLQNPLVCREILENLPPLLETLGADELRGLTGAAHS